MLQRSNNLAPIHQKSDVEFLLEKITNLEQELSDLTFEFNRAFDDRRRTS